jgi:hypothetical protein
LLAIGHYFSLLVLYTPVKLLGRGSAVAKSLPTREKHKQNKCAEIFIPRVGFEPRKQIFVRLKIVHALDRAASPVHYAFKFFH